ncbi:MAG: hypothetical protein PHW13_02965 [Methylococcales bacterium]|nr:hypothetical protein [Methylococcales bacterium]
MFLLIAVILTVTFEPADFMVDAYAGASSTNIVVATPNMSLSTPTGSPGIVTNGNQKTIQAVAGQAVTININTSDPNGYNGYVFAGATQNNQFYYAADSYVYSQNGGLYLGTPSTALLPASSTVTNHYSSVGNYSQSTFAWTPTQADTGTSVTVTFIASNYYQPTTPKSFTQSVTINTVETTTPSFSMNATQTLLLGVEAKIPVTVIPDTDNDNVLITANSLPTGAVLGTAAKNASGQWVAVLTWTPATDQIGSTTITFSAQDVQETNVVTNPVTFIVQNNASPVFASSMQAQVTAAQNIPLNYKVVVIPDAQTSDVLITATGLPAGAALSSPSLVNNHLVATMTWKPDASQIGTDFPVTFTAEDNVVGAVPVMFTTTFKAVPHYSVINRSLFNRLRH